MSFFSRNVGKRHFFLREIDKDAVQYLWPGARKEMANNLSSRTLEVGCQNITRDSSEVWQEKFYPILSVKFYNFDNAGFCMISQCTMTFSL